MTEANAATPNFRFDGRVAAVTGASSGIGRAIALGVAASGAAVGCIDLEGSDLAGVTAEIIAAGGRAISAPANVTNPDAMAASIQLIEKELGPLSLAVNAAGIANAAPAEKMPLEQWNRVIDVDLTGVFVSCQAEARAMIAGGRGAIVNIASMSATIANRGLFQAHYNAAKAGVIQLGKSLAWEWAAAGVRVNSVSPGYTYTPMTKRPEQVDAMAGYAADTPLRRNAQPEDIVGPVVFLLSDAASFVTGTEVLADGGYVIW